LDTIGLASRIFDAAASVDLGRKGFATRGKAEEGRLSYERGIAAASSAFAEALASADPHTIIFVEYTFLAQELRFCDKADTDSFASLTQAIASFDWKAEEHRQYNEFPFQRQTACSAVCPDAFLALEVVEESGYKYADKTHPRSRKYRVSGFPKDSFHIACIAHKTRLQNILRAPGIDPIEKILLKQRLANLSIAQKGYIKKQKIILA
jgi:hypothetical protein